MHLANDLLFFSLYLWRDLLAWFWHAAARKHLKILISLVP
jgi:hypothetical protein